ncbi:monosaccharide ABC transporter membrane protein, CUT2 family [Alkalispirochaeta americana]|uniref:Monosaccharide ABC transporter membrane protein, CUT2 family n=1 Tax=Alkalispirochaeta americana TaxID=159291 RepID=A0A1N6XPB6_9SPIO|nr:sugar ABC transporter permease [Alkalispirochaeta americana]SIR04059.1 monosaccharide ABC transporter membrane protein, CUT2 family [Alkalispirochaeta americana]
MLSSHGMQTEWVKEKLKKYGIVVVLFLMIVGLTIAEPNFLGRTNIFNILTQASIFGIMALGLTFVIISKGIDLSVGSILAFAGVVAASVAQSSLATNKYYPNLGELPLLIPILVALLIGLSCGALSGFFIAKTKIPPFIATLGMMTIARGFALIYTNGRPISNLDSMSVIGGRLFGVVPIPILIYAGAIALSWILLNNTKFGKNVYAIGGNATAAEVSGVDVDKNLIMIYAYSGLMAGLAAVVFAGRVGSVHPGAAQMYELTAIAATTIGGTSHSGGIGTIWGAVVGALVLAVMRNGFTLLGIDAYWQQVTEGAIIIAAVIIDMRKNARKD